MKATTQKPITQCRSCKGEILHEFLNLGDQYLSDFRKDNSKPSKYPLVAVLCDRCKLVQLKHTTPQEEMYHDRYGFKSGINEKIKEDLDSVVLHAFQYVNDPQSWLDIASNDGSLLSFVPQNVYRTGIDPVSFLCKEAWQHADRIVNGYFSLNYFTNYDGPHGEARYERFDVITSISCFYDMPDPSQFVLEVKQLLNKQGVWIIQQNYLLTTLQLSAVDNFCHEHLEYYTLKSLEHLLDRYDLQVIEVTTSMINGGSIRTVVAHKDAYPVDESVGKQRHIEYLHGVEMLVTYQMFAEDIGMELNKLRRLVSHLKNQDKTIAILAASTRGATIWQSAELDHELIEYAVERNPAKVGRNFSAIGIPIISEKEFLKRMPDYAVIGPWFFSQQIASRSEGYIKQGGHLIIPLPEVKVIDASNLGAFLSDV
jgi:NDP-4-keto-2,6-dideoxyhexose 3-C-methyltransferase